MLRRNKISNGILLALMVLASSLLTGGVSQSALAQVPDCSLSLTSIRSLKDLSVNNRVAYTLTVKNVGSRACNDVSITNHYAEGVRVISVVPRATAKNYYWYLGPLAPQAVRTVTVQLNATQSALDGLEACAAAENGSDSCITTATDAEGTVPPPVTPTPTVPVPRDQVAEEPTPNTPVPREPVKEVPQPPVVVSPDKSTLEYGMWVWESPINMSAAYISSLMASARDNGFNALYVTVDDYLLIHSLPEGAQKEAKKKAYFDAIEKLVIEAKKNDVAIDALAGWKDWAQPAMKYKAFAIVDMVVAYNRARSSNPLRSLQYDVEPYLLATYESNKGQVLTEFVALIDETNARLGNSNLRFAVTIPHFYDSAQAWTPKVTHKGVTTHTFTHLMRILDTRADSTIILMSYRNFAEGNDGTIQISEVEVNEASVPGRKTKVIVGQEFGKVDPGYVTFYGLPKVRYQTELEKIRDRFSPKTGFGGMAVHYFEPFSALR
ncbi:DUF11 domain-containing protein [Patescibacteria group bacterium]|nr:DUF11 domain-containing protein [Patescibacteria group bacterium]